MMAEKPKYQVKTALQCITDHNCFRFPCTGSQVAGSGNASCQFWLLPFVNQSEIPIQVLVQFSTVSQI